MRVRSFLRQPLVQFLVLGVLFFLLWVGFGRLGPEPENRIVISAQEIERLAMFWERQWRRPPTEAELSGLVESRIKEEVLYREALAMGLDQDDTVIRRRLAQKIEFLTEDLALAVEPTDQELAAFFAGNNDRYRTPPRFTFSHVYFSVDRRGPQAQDAAAELLTSLVGGDPVPPIEELGDRFMLRTRYADDTVEEIGRLFGSRFAETVGELPVGEWQGPVESGYGVHLVLVEERTPSRLPALEEVRDRVRDDFMAQRRKEADESLYARLREGYEVIVETPGEAPAEE
jgi:peptidyl-prolyl cis-trans isomerase C